MGIAERITIVMKDSLFRKEECPADGSPPPGAVLVEGIVQNFGFHAGRLESHRAEVAELLRHLDPKFHYESGGGWTFLNLCFDKNGQQWGEHQNGEELVCLAIGLKMGRFCMPRDFWQAFPGGVPYVEFNTEGFRV